MKSPGDLTNVRYILKLVVALHCAVVGARFCEIVHMTALKGLIMGEGGELGTNAAARCAWHINPGMKLEDIEISMQGVVFHGRDSLALHATSTWPSEDSLIATFSATRPVPDRFTVVVRQGVLIVLTAESSMTKFNLRYSCRPTESHPLHSNLSPFAYLSVLAGLVLMGVLPCLVLSYVVCYCRAKWTQAYAVQYSQLVSRADLRHRETESQDQALALEMATAGALAALPMEVWCEAHAGEERDECCLCLDLFADDDMLRVLPCNHYFHKDCVDTWFAARRFLPRSCPLCKQNPVVSTSGGTPVQETQMQRSNSAVGVPAAAVIGRSASTDGIADRDNQPRSNSESQSGAVVEARDDPDDVWVLTSPTSATGQTDTEAIPARALPRQPEALPSRPESSISGSVELPGSVPDPE